MRRTEDQKCNDVPSGGHLEYIVRKTPCHIERKYIDSLPRVNRKLVSNLCVTLVTNEHDYKSNKHIKLVYM